MTVYIAQKPEVGCEFKKLFASKWNKPLLREYSDFEAEVSVVKRFHCSSLLTIDDSGLPIHKEKVDCLGSKNSYHGSASGLYERRH